MLVFTIPGFGAAREIRALWMLRASPYLARKYLRISLNETMIQLVSMR